jgi:hypothetical protein
MLNNRIRFIYKLAGLYRTTLLLEQGSVDDCNECMSCIVSSNSSIMRRGRKCACYGKSKLLGYRKIGYGS